MIKNILVPVDFSQASMNALEYAAFIARKNQGFLNIIHIITRTDPFPGFHPASVVITKISSEKELFVKGIKSVEDKIRRISGKKFLADIPYRFDVKISGNPVKEIISYSCEIRPDIIVMGTYGETGFMKNLMGSVTSRVIFLADVPVLMVNRKIKYPKKKIIVFASDFSEESYKIFPYVKNFSDSIEAEIHLLVVNTPFADKKRNAASLLEFSGKFKGKFKKIIYEKTFVIDGIIEYSKSVGAVVIAMASHGRRGIIRWFDKNTFEIIRDFSKFSVLALNVKTLN
ncbi:MAG: universal stress protein [Ignavibacteria bacterium]|nr:universal stress protein [Ignavibacteria bacterium]